MILFSIVDKLKFNNETKKILSGLKEWEDKHEGFKRILVVTHGGYIMEFYNVMKQIMGQKVSTSNCAKNCAVYIFGVDNKPKNKQETDQLNEGRLSLVLFIIIGCVCWLIVTYSKYTLSKTKTLYYISLYSTHELPQIKFLY